MEMEICRRGPASLAPLKAITESSPNCMNFFFFFFWVQFYSNFRMRLFLNFL